MNPSIFVSNLFFILLLPTLLQAYPRAGLHQKVISPASQAQHQWPSLVAATWANLSCCAPRNPPELQSFNINHNYFEWIEETPGRLPRPLPALWWREISRRSWRAPCPTRCLPTLTSDNGENDDGVGGDEDDEKDNDDECDDGRQWFPKPKALIIIQRWQ